MRQKILYTWKKQTDHIPKKIHANLHLVFHCLVFQFDRRIYRLILEYSKAARVNVWITGSLIVRTISRKQRGTAMMLTDKTTTKPRQVEPYLNHSSAKE